MAEEASKPRTDADWVALLGEESRLAIGYTENSPELREDRERALNYIKGDMSKDIPSLPNRSKAVATTVADAIETLMPDLMEIFTGGDDVLAFTPNSEKDEAQAQQETDYLTHVVFQDNADGFLSIYTGIKDALTTKTGVWMYWWEKKEKVEEEKFQAKNAAEVIMASQEGEIVGLMEDPAPVGAAMMATLPEPTYSFTLRKTNDLSYAKFQALPSEDLSVARDTVSIADATYCNVRTRPRVQDAIADGLDADKVRNLPQYNDTNNTTERARDTAGEHTETEADNTNSDLRQVEIIHHYVKVLEGDDPCLYKFATDAEVTKLLNRPEKVSRINIAVGTPFIVPHRMHGQSLADKLIQTQQQMTAVLRAALDTSYFSLNQRLVVTDSGANSFTISDILNNTPGAPIRVKAADAVQPVRAGGMTFDPYALMEFLATQAEQKTGIVRNAQGLNPDTLHDTKGGMQALMSAAQRRTRMIARILAETALKPLYLGLHALLRENASSERIVKLRGKWVPVNPSKWAERNAMTIEVGLGAAGVEADLVKFAQLAQAQSAIVSAQGGPTGPVVDFSNIYALGHDMFSKLSKKADRYLTDPKSEEGQAAMKAKAEQPSPEMAKVQAQTQADMAKTQQEGQIKTAQMQQQGALDEQKMNREFELKKYQIDAEMQLKERQLVAELELKERQMAAELEMQERLGVHKTNVTAASSTVHPGGAPG